MIAVTMSFLENEDKKYAEEVKAVKAWWQDSRWRYTKRPFTAEQIVAKRGNLNIDYPSNAQSRKLWGILENNFKVRGPRQTPGMTSVLIYGRPKTPASPMAALSRQWSPRWPSTWTPSMCPAGRARPLPPRPTSPPPILPTTLW